MKILLIDPPYGVEEIGGERKNFKYALNKIPSLGLGYLAGVAEKKGHEVKIVDCTLEYSPEKLKNLVKEFKPQIVGVTATTPTFNNAVKVTAILREIIPEAKFLCGGPHPTADPLNSLSSDIFDILVLGEGEETFIELLEHIKDDKPLDAVKGIAFKKNGQIHLTPPRPKIENLDSLPFPRRDLFPPLKKYSPTPASYRKLPLAVIMTSRGCPHKCTFCDRAVFGEKFRRRSVENVMAEVEEVLIKFGTKEIRFFDDNFTLDKEFCENICKEMRKLRLKIPWTCLTSVKYADFGLFKLMRESGCWQVLFGLESGDDGVLKKLGKGTTVEANRKAVLLARKAGLRVRADFLVGSPWETPSTLRKTVEFAKSLPLDFAHFNKFVPYPGTDIYRELVSQGYSFNFDKGAFINNQCDLIYCPPAFSPQEFKVGLNKAYKEFYLRPNYIIQKLLAIRTVTELIGHVKGGLSILSLQ